MLAGKVGNGIVMLIDEPERQAVNVLADKRLDIDSRWVGTLESQHVAGLCTAGDDKARQCAADFAGRVARSLYDRLDGQSNLRDAVDVRRRGSLTVVCVC